MWAENAWDFSDPERLLGVGGLIFVLALPPYILLFRQGVRAGAAALGLAGAVYVFLNWHQLDPHPLLWLGSILALAVLAHLRLRPDVIRWVFYVALAILTVAPLAQLVIAHVADSEPYPIIDREPAGPATATGKVEDVVIVVVDSYPSLALAKSWFAHDTSVVVDELHKLGFEVETTGWSQHTFTGLAVPAMLELRPVAEPGPKGRWGNRLSTYEIVRGDNYVAHALRSAGYHYTHIESGWDGGSCGLVDTCLQSNWMDEAMWELLRPSLASDLIIRTHGFHTVGNSLTTVRHLKSQSSRFDDGRQDYLFAHLLLPHSPLVVDETCDLAESGNVRSERFSPADDTSERFARLREQLACVDRLIVEIATLAGPDTAMVVAGDHGTATLGQLTEPPQEWSDSDIAERLGIFLAYSIPESCPEPETSVSSDVVRSIIDCALETQLPRRNGSFFIGADDPVLVTDQRIARIESRLLNGALRPDPGS